LVECDGGVVDAVAAVDPQHVSGFDAGVDSSSSSSTALLCSSVSALSLSPSPSSVASSSSSAAACVVAMLRDRWRVTAPTPPDLAHLPLRLVSEYGGIVTKFL
jgi:hypothetical protein